MQAPETILSVLLVWGLGINLAGFAAMGADKRRARRHKRRIPEATLLTVALLGGSVGSIAGMFSFHHKTKHPKFRVGLPVILALQVAACLLFFAWKSGML
jgi:uncharacterized membrane protein YsdA (DUF1294 family)